MLVNSLSDNRLSLILNRFSGNSLFILDEPEASLSPSRQMTLLAVMKQLLDRSSQFIVATHSPILLSFPGASIHQISNGIIEPVEYRETESYQITQAFLRNPERTHRELFKE